MAHLWIGYSVVADRHGPTLLGAMPGVPTVRVMLVVEEGCIPDVFRKPARALCP